MCQALWYVVTVERPRTDPDLDMAINTYAHRFPGALALIVTKTDTDINDALALDMRVVKGRSIGDYKGYEASIKENERMLNRIRTRLQRNTLTGAEKNMLRERGEVLKIQLQAVKTEKFERIVDARNSHITACLKEEKAHYLKDGMTLPIFCVSNYNYAVRKGVAHEDGPVMGIEATGIPALRSYALSLAAPAVWDDCMEILVHRTKVLFNGVHGWAHNVPEPRNRSLPAIVKTVENTWDAISGASVDKCNGRFEKEVVAKLHAKLPSSFGAAMSYFQTVTKEWNPLTVLAFFRNEGKHTTRAVGPHSWNDKFLDWQTRKVLEPAWYSWPNPEDSFDEGVEKLINALEDIPDQLKRMPESIPALPMASFAKILEGQIARIRAERNRIANDYQEVHGNIKLDACRDQYTGFFTEAMAPCYLDGKDDKGEGVCARVSTAVSNHLRFKDPFGTANDKYEMAFKEAVSAQELALSTKVKKILSELDRQFELILRKNTESYKEERARYKIGRALTQLMPEIDRIEVELEKIQQQYAGGLARK